MKQNRVIGLCFSGGIQKQKGRDIIAPDTRARVDKAYSLYQNGYITKILCTGGIFKEGQNISVAVLMRDYLISLGVPKSDILVEPKSLDTVENIKLSFALLKRLKYFKNPKTAGLCLVLISERLHLRRIDILAKAYLRKYKLENIIQVILKPVTYKLSKQSKFNEKMGLKYTILDLLGQSEIFAKIRRERRANTRKGKS